MKKIVVLFLTILILFPGCDPISVSRIYLLNSTDIELTIKVKTKSDGHLEKTIKAGEIILLYDAHRTGTKAVEPSESILILKILNSHGNIIKSINSKPELFKLFNEKELAFGSKDNSYLIVIDEKLLYK